MSDEKKRWDDFRKKNPKIKIEVEEKYLLNSREIVTAKYLQKLWGVSDRTIRTYVNDGMPLLKESSHRFKIFDLIECISWRMTQIDLTKSNVSKQQEEESEVESLASRAAIANLTEQIDKAEIASEEKLIKIMKRKELEGSLISVDDVDKVSAEQAVLHKTDIMNAEKILPTILENLDKGEVAEALREHNQKRLDDLDELIQKEFDCDETLYEIVIEAINALQENNPQEIIEKIKG